MIELTICLAFSQHLGQVNLRVPYELWLSQIICVTRQCHEFPALDFGNVAFLVVFWRGRRRSRTRGCALGLEECKPNLFVPLWVLATTLDRLRPLVIAIELNSAVGVLFANVPFVR